MPAMTIVCGYPINIPMIAPFYFHRTFLLFNHGISPDFCRSSLSSEELGLRAFLIFLFLPSDGLDSSGAGWMVRPTCCATTARLVKTKW